MTTHAPFEFFESDDRALIAAYTELRQRVFRLHYPWLPPGFGIEDDTDRASCRVLARQNGEISGGARLTCSLPERRRKLPLEECGFNLQTCPFLADMRLERQPYAEISRMAIDPHCTEGLQASFGLARELCRAAARRGVDIVFSICPEGPARLNRLNARKCGVAYHIYSQLPTAFGVPMWLCAFSGISSVFGASCGAGACGPGIQPAVLNEGAFTCQS